MAAVDKSYDLTMMLSFYIELQEVIASEIEAKSIAVCSLNNRLFNMNELLLDE